MEHPAPRIRLRGAPRFRRTNVKIGAVEVDERADTGELALTTLISTVFIVEYFLLIPPVLYYTRVGSAQDGRQAYFAEKDGY